MMSWLRRVLSCSNEPDDDQSLASLQLAAGDLDTSLLLLRRWEELSSPSCLPKSQHRDENENGVPAYLRLQISKRRSNRLKSTVEAIYIMPAERIDKRVGRVGACFWSSPSCDDDRSLATPIASFHLALF
jgi:hypothetical protein